MGIFSRSGTGLSGLSFSNPREVLKDLLQTSSGATLERQVRYNIFNQIVAFKGVKEGIGCSTIVANTALLIAKLGLTVCVIDTSIVSPSQDILLKTTYNDEKEKAVDWFEMGFSDKSVLNLSSIDSRVSVLSFHNRTYVDMLSTSDNPSLVELALSQLSTKFDILLIDICHEPTNIAATCLQMAQKVIQIWSNGETCLRNVESFIKNNIVLSCAMDKMRYVVTSMTIDSVPTEWDELMRKYHFKHLSHVGLSLEIARIAAQGQTLLNHPTRDKSIQEFNDCITDIVAHLLDINSNIKKSQSIYPPWGTEEGRNDGELQKYYDDIKDYPEISQRAVSKAEGVSNGENSYNSGVYTHNESDNISSDSTSDDSLDLFATEEIVQDAPEETAKKSKFFRRG